MPVHVKGSVYLAYEAILALLKLGGPAGIEAIRTPELALTIGIVWTLAIGVSTLVRMRGLEPPRLSALVPKTSVYTIPPHPHDVS